MTTTLAQNPPQQPSSSSTLGVPLPPDLEPDEDWKDRLRAEIEDGFRSMYDEARQSLADELAKRVVSAEEREEISKEHVTTIQNIRKLAAEQFNAALERERQERRWAAGEQLDRAWSEGMIKEQQAILDRIEKERKMKATQLPLPQPRPPPQQPALTQRKPDNPDTSSTPQRKVEHVARTPTQVAESERDGSGTYFTRAKTREPDDIGPSLDDVPPIRPTGKARAGSITSIGSYKPPSFLDAERSFFGRSGSSVSYDEPEAMPRSVRSPSDVPDTPRRESIRRKPSMGTTAIIPEIWKPSITPEEDAQMSRTFTLARRSSVTSTTSSWRAPSVLNAAFSDPLDATNSNMERERTGIHMQDQEWSNLDRAREKEKQFSAHAENRPGLSTPQRQEERVGMSQASAPPNSIPYARSNDSSRSYPTPFAPPPSASRPIVNKKSFTIDEGYPSQSSPSSRNWNSASRSPYETRFEGSSSRSPQTPDDFPRSWQSSNLRGRFSSQDMRYNYLQQEGGSGYTGRSVHTHHEEDFEDQSDDGISNANWKAREYNDRRIMEIEESLRLREEAANKKEEELKKRTEELRREEEARKVRTEELRREEEARKLRAEELKREEEAKRSEEEATRKEDIAKQKEEDMRRKEEDAKRKEDEIRRKELEAMRKEEEVRRKEEEAKKKERDVKLKEDEAKRKEREARLREMEARRKEEEARRKEEEVKMIEEEARRKESEAKRKQEEALRKEREAARKEEEAMRKEEEARQKAEEARRKEEELRKREEELKRREADLTRREAEARRREEDKQKVQQEEFRKREEEIRRQRAEENSKKRQDSFSWESWGTSQESFRPTPPPQTSTPSAPWPIPNRNDRSTSGASPPTDRSSTNSTRSTTAGWTSTSARSTSTTGTPATPASATPKPAAGTSSTPKPSANPPLTEAEFHRRQAEQAQQREEQFRREQARLAMQEHERQAKSGKMMSKQEVAKLFEAHRSQWDKIPTLTSLIWEDFPWPMFKRPNGPDDLTMPAVTAYMLSPIHPQDKGTKDRIKDALRKWHPDRFETSHLPKVKPDERGKVSDGAGAVVRILNQLLNMSVL